MMIRFFFFSSRRRHTRWPRDWSSDVCSSDLRCASTTPPPPKLTVRVTLRGNVSTAHVSTVSGVAPRNARACSRTSVRLSIRPAPEVLEPDEAIDHAGSAVLQRLLLGVDHELRLERRFVGVRA